MDAKLRKLCKVDHESLACAWHSTWSQRNLVWTGKRPGPPQELADAAAANQIVRPSNQQVGQH